MAISVGSRLTIGELAKRTGVKVPTIRYYETIDLLPAPDRNAGNQRRYTEQTANSLRFIRHARDLGFEVDQIRDLLAIAAHPEFPCTEVDAIARRHLVHVEQRIAILRSLQVELKRMITQCSGGRVANCRIIEVLADHAHCQSDHQRDSAKQGGSVAPQLHLAAEQRQRRHRR
jgi:DNA-binding transcriptional MerR regulator